MVNTGLNFAVLNRGYSKVWPLPQDPIPNHPACKLCGVLRWNVLGCVIMYCVLLSLLLRCGGPLVCQFVKPLCEGLCETFVGLSGIFQWRFRTYTFLPLERNASSFVFRHSKTLLWSACVVVCIQLGRFGLC